MASSSSDKDKTMEYDKQLHKKGVKSKNHLAGRLNKFQETINQNQTSTTPHINSIHNYEDLDQNILKQIKDLHQLIKDHGQQGDYAIQITFAELISIYGENQIDKLIEILSVARKNGYMNYNGNDPLQKDEDEEVLIRLIKTPY